MKKILFILLVSTGIYSCNSKPTLDPASKFPMEINALKKMNKVDTLLVVESENKYYFYKKDNTFMGNIYKESSDTIYLVILIVGLIVGLIIGVAFGVIIKH